MIEARRRYPRREGPRAAPGRRGAAHRPSAGGQACTSISPRQRAMTGRTGCGVCGIDDIAELRRAARRRRRAAADRRHRDCARPSWPLDARQALNARTHAVHAAAWADASGDILHVREDVGRHKRARQADRRPRARRPPIPRPGFVLITSRCSFEMVEKTATFGTRVLVAISAPTSLAIERGPARST